MRDQRRKDEKARQGQGKRGSNTGGQNSLRTGWDQEITRPRKDDTKGDRLKGDRLGGKARLLGRGQMNVRLE